MLKALINSNLEDLLISFAKIRSPMKFLLILQLFAFAANAFIVSDDIRISESQEVIDIIENELEPTLKSLLAHKVLERLK